MLALLRFFLRDKDRRNEMKR